MNMNIIVVDKLFTIGIWLNRWFLLISLKPSPKSKTSPELDAPFFTSQAWIWSPGSSIRHRSWRCKVPWRTRGGDQHGSRDQPGRGVGTPQSGWWFGTFFIFPYIGNNHPNWLSYFSEGWPNHQPVMNNNWPASKQSIQWHILQWEDTIFFDR